MRGLLAVVSAVLSLSPGVLSAQDSGWTGLYGGVSMATTDGSHVYNTGSEYGLEGPAFGAFGGYMWGNGNLVYGAEAALTFGGVYETSTTSDNTYKDEYEYSRFFDMKGRVGYAMSDFLVYGTLGLTQGRFLSDIGASDQANTYPTGTVYGVGADYKFGGKFFAGAEYVRRQFDFYDEGQDVDIDADIDVFTLRLGMKF